MSRYEHIALKRDGTLAEVAIEIEHATGATFQINREGEYSAALDGNIWIWLSGPDPLGDGFDEIEDFNYDLSIRGDSIEEQEVGARRLFELFKDAGRLPIALALNDYQGEVEIFPQAIPWIGES